ncbi:MAG: uncharacterized protein KVP18_000262 [Porospora cf. gigantea A]|uniref:uncharacterized protein n=1 Tax=Porospora cf. gigantea A TaxID=2853593 RepID=UPI00355A2327|nr:MAG: hypothetical protein KVP18_000262 [Porospora cf. gigantea A]
MSTALIDALKGCASLAEHRPVHTQRIFTFSMDVDSILDGGVPVGAGITEICGLPGTGKSQLCMQLAVTVQVPTGMSGESS